MNNINSLDFYACRQQQCPPQRSATIERITWHDMIICHTLDARTTLVRISLHFLEMFSNSTLDRIHIPYGLPVNGFSVLESTSMFFRIHKFCAGIPSPQIAKKKRQTVADAPKEGKERSAEYEPRARAHATASPTGLST